MKNRTIFISVLIAAVIICGGLAYVANRDTATTNDTPTPTRTSQTEQQAKEAVPETSTSNYITLAEYNSNQEKFKDSKKVYFFHASWCPICKSIDEEITANTNTIPDDVTIIKTDFDSSIDLRKKYGVTYQYTFVQVDSNGDETAQWSATTLAKVLNGIN